MQDHFLVTGKAKLQQDKQIVKPADDDGEEKIENGIVLDLGFELHGAKLPKKVGGKRLKVGGEKGWWLVVERLVVKRL
jgi:hypothetical protein